MPYYEVAFETGRRSVAYYETDEEAQAALGAHHKRAENGEPGGPIGQPAERVAKVRVYDKHPDDYNVDQTMHVEQLEKEVAALVKALADENGVVRVDQLAIEVRNLTHPMQEPEGSFDSIFKMKEKRTLALPFE